MMVTHMAGSLAGKVALVTGGASGIGREVAQALAREGAQVAITYFVEPPAEADRLVLELRGLSGGGRTIGAYLDVRSMDGIRQVVDRVVTELGRIDILVNSAGINRPQMALDVDEKSWDDILDINLKGLFFVSQAVARVMIDRPPGDGEWHSIVNISSQMGLIGYYRRAAYCSSKAGVVNLTRVLAIEWAPHRIRVNAVAPTFIRTPLTEPMFKEEAFLQDILKRSPMGMIGEPSDVAAGVLYLCGNGARLVTGHALAIDGGWTAW